MTHNITPQQQLTENLDIKAAMWANRIMTRKISNQQCKQEIWQEFADHETRDIEDRVRKYLNKGLITSEHYEPKIDESLNRIRQAVNKPTKTYTNGSEDGLWSTEVSKR